MPQASTMIDRRTMLQLPALRRRLLAPTIAQARTAQTAWKTAIGLNGFMSSSADYGKTFPIWEMLDFAQPHRL